MSEHVGARRHGLDHHQHSGGGLRTAAGAVDSKPIAEAHLNCQGRQADSVVDHLRQLQGIFTGDVFSSALINSIGIGLITTVIAVVIGGMAAYAVADWSSPASGR